MRSQAELDAMQDKVDEICDEHARNPVLSAIQDVLMWVRENEHPESAIMDHVNAQISCERLEQDADNRRLDV